MQGHYADGDDFLPVDQVRELESTLRDLGNDAEFFVYEGTGHAFFNDTRPDAYNEAAAGQAWQRTLAFFRDRVT